VSVADILKQTGALDSISRQLGVDPSMVQAGAEALLPAILGGFKKQAQAQPETGSLGGLLDGLGVSASPSTETGNEILGQIFGSKDVSRTVAGQASQNTGIDPALLKKMLPLLATVITAYLANRGSSQQTGSGGLLGQVLGGLFGGGQGGGQAAGGLASLIDLNGDGNPLDDILGMAAKLGRSS